MRLRRQSLVLGIVAGIALLSIGANLWFAHRLQQAFAELQWARIFPVGIPAADAPRAPPSGKPRLALYGDSRALLWNTASLAGQFEIVNLAQGAQTSAQLVLQLAARPPVESDWALVEIGINDLHPLGVFAGREALIEDQLADNLTTVVRTLETRSRCVAIVTILPPGPVPLERRATWSPGTLAAIEAANQVIHRLADGERVFVFDGAALLSDEAHGLAVPYRTPDAFLHLNEAGYDVLNRGLQRILVNTLVVAAESGADSKGPGRDPGALSPCRENRSR